MARATAGGPKGRDTRRRTTAARRAARAPSKAKASSSPSPAAKLPRIAKGKKPQYFSDPATDKLLWMTLTLMEELSVARDRIDTLERVLAGRKLVSLADLEGYIPDPTAAAERAERRAAYVERMMRAVHAELEEITAKGDPTSEAVRAVEE